MNKRILGSDSGLEVSAVGLGCMGFSHAYGAPMPDEEAVRMIRYAYELGYTLFDTAEIYGTPDDPNLNERIVGEALKPMRNHVRIASKFGIRFDYNCTSVNKFLVPNSRPEIIRSSVEGSLKRLRTDHIDLYFQHRIDPSVEPEAVADVMNDLIKEGKILHWGISEATEDYLRRANAVCQVTAVQNRYSMMARQHEELFPVLEELGVGFIAFSPMANGFLSGKYNGGTVFDRKYDYRSNMPQFTEDAVNTNRELMTAISEVASLHNATPAQISLAWMLCKKSWIVPIPGIRKPEHLKENLEAAEILLSAKEVGELGDLLNHIPMSAVFGGSKIVKK